MGRHPASPGPWRLLSVCALWVGLCLGVGCSRRPPDVYLITVDTLRADHVGAWGYAAASTPTLDGLAARGFHALNGVTPFPRTTPAMASLMTGLRPEAHGSREVGQRPQSGASLARVLKERGYFTVGISANGACGAAMGFGKGFDRFTDADALESLEAAAVTDRALQAVEGAQGAAPLFLWAHYVDPHTPYAAPGASADDPCSEVQAHMFGDRAYGEVQGDRGGIARAALPACIARYDAEIAAVDRQVGRLLLALGARDPEREAYIILTSDHGEQLGEEGLYYEHGPLVSEASVHIPLLFVGPGVVARPYEGIVRLQDVMPTLLGLLNVDRALWPVMGGVDLSETLKGGATPNAPELALIEAGSPLHTDLFAFPVSGQAFGRHCWNDPPWSLCAPPTNEPELYNHVEDPGLKRELGRRQPRERARLMELSRAWRPEQARQQAARGPRFKLVARPRLAGGYAYALYDLKADPAEATDVSAQHPEEVERLRNELKGWRLGLPAVEPVIRGKEQQELLKTLGYQE